MYQYLGRGGFNSGVRVYLANDCIEVEDRRPVDIVRRRVFLDDIVMVTHSRRFGWLYLMPAAIVNVIITATVVLFFPPFKP